MRKLALTLVLALALPLVLAACGGDDPAPTATTAPQATVEKSLEDQLYEQALAVNGGEIEWVFPTRPEQGEPIIAAFEAEYPGLKVNLTTKSTSEVTEALLLEAQAGKVTADVTDPGRDRRLFDAGIFANSTAIFDDVGIEAGARYANDQATMYVPLAHGVMYNTERVTGDDIPQTWEDVLDPKWKGDMVLEDRLKGFIYMTDLPAYNGRYENLWTEDEVAAYLEKLALQEPLIMHGNTTIANAVSSGEVALSPDVNVASIGNSIVQGAPVEWAPVSPNPIEQWLIGATVDGPNPPGGQLLLRWMNSITQGIPVRVEVQPGTSLDPASGDPIGIRAGAMNIQIGYTGIEMADEFNRLTKKYREIMGIPTS